MTVSARPLRLSTADAGFEAAFRARLFWSSSTDAATTAPTTQEAMAA